jgi:DNA-binding HxlR family transcriptional regulator
MAEPTQLTGPCPLNAFHMAVGGKYKMRIVWELIGGPKRFGELSRSAIVTAMGKAVTPRVLSRELKELEQRGLIHRRQYPVIPPKVEYSLTDLGRSVVPVIRKIVDWGMLNRGPAERPLPRATVPKPARPRASR